MSNVTDIQELRLIKMRKELQAEIDLTLAWIDEVAARNGWADKREGENESKCKICEGNIAFCADCQEGEE